MARCKQLETELNGLRSEPEIVHADVRVASGLPKSCGQGAEYLRGLHRDPQLRLAAQPLERCRRLLLPGSGPQ